MKILELTTFSSGGCGVWARVKQESELFAKRGHEVMILSSNIEKGSNKIVASEDVIHSQESPSVEKPFETTDYEPTNGVFARSIRISTTADDLSAHPDGFHIKIFRYPGIKLGGESFMLWFKGDAFEKALDFKPDVIFVHNYRHLHTTKGLRLAKQLKIPCYLITHAPFVEGNITRTKFQTFIVNMYDRFIGKRTINKFDKILAISHWEKPALLRVGAEEARIVYSPNGIPEEFFIIPIYEGNSNRILFLGRIAPKKKIETLINAIPYIKDRKVEIVITGPQEKEYMNELRKLPNFKNVRFFPPVYNLKEKISLIDSCKIYVLPSRVEGMPQGLIEAMVRGKTVISTDSIAIRDLITDGDNGYLFEFNNPKSLAEKINYAISNPIDGSDSIKSFNWNILIKELELLWK